MILDLSGDKNLTIDLHNRDYFVTISGNGFPCLSIGLGSIAQRTLSKKFKENFCVYSSDWFWDKKSQLIKKETLSLDLVIDETIKLSQKLGLEKPILIGHSAWGILALEIAKQYPDFASDLLLIGTPLHWNAESIALHNKIFYTQADNKRQAIDKERKEIVSQEDLSLLSPHDRFLREYVFRDAARYWHDPSFDCSDLWQDIEVDESIDLWFSKILPAINVRENLQNIQCPLYIAAGLSDFDCCPYLWENEKRMPPKTQIEKYCSSGHYPHYEESPLFDKNVVKWVQENIL